jgi:subtilisin family serine protease
VTQRYDNVDAVAVRVPRAAVTSLVSLAGAESVRKDVEIAAPKPALLDLTDQLADPQALDTGAAALPSNYNFNLAITNAAPLHAAGKRGQGVVVAVIDSGTANAPGITALAGSVIGGETFVPLDPLSATHRENGSHGTMTAEMAAAHAAFLFGNGSALVGALNRYAPGSAIPCASTGPPPICPTTLSIVPLTGTAPNASIYAMKVFHAAGGGAPESRVIAAMDRAITLRRNYNTTGANAILSGTGTESDPVIYSALKIDVVNMSLGGPTLFAGRDIEDQLTLAMLDVGITLVTSAGNDGFAAMTGGSPGTGLGSLTVGAASTAVHERIVRDLQFGAGAGAVVRPSAHVQTAYFSSRGPTADGRNDPDLVANGDYSFVQAYLGIVPPGVLADCREPGVIAGSCVPRLVFASGTSFSSPTVAGAAALLRREHPGRSATQIRNALQKSANPALLGDDSTRIDRGNGFLDIAAADTRLTTTNVSPHVPDLPPPSDDDDEDDDEDDGAVAGASRTVQSNLERAGFQIARFRDDRYSTRIRDLKPGEVAQIFVPSDLLTSALTVTIDRVTPQLPPAQQNQFWICGPAGGEYVCGDDIFFMVVDAPTSFAVTRASGFPNATESFTGTIANPQTGLVRVALQGDWTNGGPVSASVTIKRHRKFDGLPTAVGLVTQDELDYIEVDVPAGAAAAVFELAWTQNWGRYPTNDVDLVLIDPANGVNFSGATSSSPERVEIANPMAGRWTAVIQGFTIHGPEDAYSFRAEADGRRLRKVK